jgi:hypothetical protein
VTDFPVVNVPIDELSSARIWQDKLCATLSANVNINYRLPIKVQMTLVIVTCVSGEGPWPSPGGIAGHTNADQTSEGPSLSSLNKLHFLYFRSSS